MRWIDATHTPRCLDCGDSILVLVNRVVGSATEDPPSSGDYSFSAECRCGKRDLTALVERRMAEFDECPMMGSEE